MFEGLGLVERLDLPNGRHAYVVCQPDHHHHVVCTNCGRSAEVGDLGLTSITDEVEAQTGFALDSHRIELYGLCPECRATGIEAGHVHAGGLGRAAPLPRRRLPSEEVAVRTLF